MLRKRAFTIGYDPTRREPLWVAYQVEKVNVGLSALTRRKFSPDPELPSEESARDADYGGSGYDRGHMAPFASIRRRGDPRPEFESCYFSNICPQKPDLNRGAWQVLEARIRDWAVKYGQVWVIVGPVFGPESGVTPSGRVAVPTAFYMVVARGSGRRPEVLAFKMSQDVRVRRPRLEDYLVSVDEVEAETGLDFLDDLPDELEKQIEPTRSSSIWMN